MAPCCVESCDVARQVVANGLPDCRPEIDESFRPKKRTKFQVDMRLIESGKYDLCPETTPARHAARGTSRLQKTVSATASPEASRGTDSARASRPPSARNTTAWWRLIGLVNGFWWKFFHSHLLIEWCRYLPSLPAAQVGAATVSKSSGAMSYQRRRAAVFECRDRKHVFQTFNELPQRHDGLRQRVQVKHVTRGLSPALGRFCPLSAHPATVRSFR